VREIPVIRAGLRGKSVHEGTSPRVEIVPRLLQVLEAEPIQQAKYTLAQRQTVQTLADGVRNFLPLPIRAGRGLFGRGGDVAQELFLILAPTLALAKRLHRRDREDDLRDRLWPQEGVVKEQDDVRDPCDGVTAARTISSRSLKNGSGAAWTMPGAFMVKICVLV
jgi:hypothetical protein